jgi:hypothetical protein
MLFNELAKGCALTGLPAGKIGVRYGFRNNKEALELAILQCVPWFNHQRLLSSIGYIPSAKAEVNFYRQLAERNATEVSA